MKFNINDIVKVKLKEDGYKRLVDNHNKLALRIPNLQNRDIQSFKDKADKDGYTQFQLWVFIQEFEGTFEMGMSGYYENNIIIPIERKDKSE